MPERHVALKAKLQILLGEEIAMGPGKAALLTAIDDSGSISAAARKLGMSYRRAWLLVETVNRCFADPLVETHPGEGARLTALGTSILTAYRCLDALADAIADDAAYRLIAAALKRTDN